MRDDFAEAEALSAPEQPSPSEMADDDPAAPWNDPTNPVAGMKSATNRRLSWEGSQRRKAEFSVIEGSQDDDEPPDDGYEPPDQRPDERASDAELVPAEPIELVAAADWPHEAPPPMQWVVRDKIPRGDVATLDGDGGLGKTMAAEQLAVAVVRGAADWLGWEVIIAAGRPYAAPVKDAGAIVSALLTHSATLPEDFTLQKN